MRDSYRNWYADSRENVKQLKQQARAYNATQEKKEQETRSRRKPTKREQRRKSPRRETWLDFARPQTRQQYREFGRHFDEFITKIGNKGINDLRGSDFTTYVKSVSDGARDNGKDVKSFCGNRFRNVKAAFNRVMKIQPDEFSQPERVVQFLTILETRASNPNEQNSGNGRATVNATAYKTGRLSPKEKLSPRQFRGLVKAACTQWRALLMLAYNAALKNSDVGAIRWCHLDLGGRDYVFSQTEEPTATPNAAGS